MAPPIKEPGSKLPALRGRLMVDTINGRVRIRSWPKKRGPNVPPQVRVQNERFASAQRLAASTKGSVMNRFKDATKNTGLYPRDLFTKLVLAPPFEIVKEDGTVLRHGRRQLENAVFQGFYLKLSAGYGVNSGALREPPWDVPILDSAGFHSAGAPSIITIPQGVAVMQFFAGYSSDVTTAAAQGLYIRRIAPSVEFICAHSAQNVQHDNISSPPIPVAEGETYAMTMFFNTTKTITAAMSYFGGVVLAAEV